MGMFDEIRCFYPLPVKEAQEFIFQTKDTDAQYLDKYEIREDGTLWHHDYDPRFVEEPDSPFGITIKQENPRVVKVDFNGTLEMYHLESTPAKDVFYRFFVTFESGVVSMIRADIENLAPK